MAQWNLGGQKPWLLDVTACDADIIAVQELSRCEAGWRTFDTAEFHWVSHRSENQWRGVGIAIALDKFDSILYKVASSRGLWVVARLKGLGRVLLGSLHCHTGVTNAIYQAAVHEFFATCPRRFRHLPVFCGVDANEVPVWVDSDSEDSLEFGTGNGNINELVAAAMQLGMRPSSPLSHLRHAPTHFPRDESREGRQIDMIFVKQLHALPHDIDAERRHCIGSDHALLHGDLLCSPGSSKSRWFNDSRPRWVTSELPSDFIICDEDDVRELAKRTSRPRRSLAYKDNDEVKNAIAQARADKQASTWKRAHRLRQECRAKWKRERLSAVLGGDWDLYKQLQNEKKRVRGWWGDLLRERSAREVTCEVKSHFEKKMVDPAGAQWDETLQDIVAQVAVDTPFLPFSKIDVRSELQAMKCRSAVGPDGVSVHFLRVLIDHETLGDDFLELINHIVEHDEMPASWGKSFLALLAKVPSPTSPKDLRPICVSSAFHKLVSRLVCSRALPSMRCASNISCCGKGRQAADLIGTASRVRDVCKEWKVPLLVAKLDVEGAFDRIRRDKVADFLVSQLRGSGIPHELRYLLRQLATHHLAGLVPGGSRVDIYTNIGLSKAPPRALRSSGSS